MGNEYAVIITSEQAKARVMQSNLSQQDKKYFLIFIKNFEELTFYYNKSFALDELELDLGIKFPQQLRVYRDILASVLYGFSVEFKFKSFIRSSPRKDYIDFLWYSVDLLGMPTKGDLRDLFLTTSSNYSFIPIATVSGDRNAENYFLAMNLHNNDLKIYEFDTQDLFDNKSTNESIEQSAYEIFDSYPQMLAHISEIKYLDGKKEIIIKARED
jgi:hypothetical protein